MELDPSGNPIVAAASIANVYHSTWTGTSWVDSAPINYTADTNARPSLALDAAGRPLIVARSFTTVASLWIARLSEGNWVPALPVSIPAGPSGTNFRMRAAPDHSPVVAWLDLTVPKVALARWTGATWNTRASAYPTGSLSQIDPKLVVDANGTVWVGWIEDGSLRVWMFNY